VPRLAHREVTAPRQERQDEGQQQHSHPVHTTESHLSNLSPQQQQVVNAFNRAADRYDASPKVRKALLEAGLVESGLRNLHYGDRDSLGALQERTSIYGAKQALNPYASAVRFIREAQPIAGKYGKAGDLAQAVQRSAFPGRYQQQSATANQLLHASGRFPSASAGSKGAATRTIPGQDRSGERRSLLLNYLLGNSGGDLLSTVQQIAATKDTPARTVRVPGSSAPRAASSTGLKPTFKRVDQGQDLQFAPGRVLPALGNGVVKTVASDPSGFGPSYPVIHFTSGPLAGQDVYYGHTISLVRPGQRVKAGQGVGRTSAKGGIGNATTPGWAEIGLWPPGNMNNGAKIAGVLRQVFR